MTSSRKMEVDAGAQEISAEAQEGGVEKSQEESRLEEKNQDDEPLLEDESFSEGGQGSPERAEPEEIEHGKAEYIDESANESETSEERRMKAERRMKSRTLLTVRQREMELQKEEDERLEAERIRKGKSIATSVPRRNRSRRASRTVRIQEPAEREQPVVVTFDYEDETTLGEDRRRARGLITVEINDRTKKVVSTFEDEEDRAIYKLKTDASVKNRVQQSIQLDDLDGQGVRKKLIQYLLKIGFGWFLQLGICEVPLMFAEEFFTTFRFTATTDLDKPTISFRLLDLEFEMSINEWAVRLGVASICEITMSYWKKMDMGGPWEAYYF